MPQYHYIISFCNNKLNTDGQGLLGQVLIDIETETASFTPITLEGLDSHNPRGITGLCHHQGGYVGLLQAKVPQLIFMDQDFNVYQCWSLPELKGTHTILSDDECIYLSVTGQDLICKTRDGQLFDTLWSTGTNADTIHLNSICFHQGTLLFTAFGPKQENGLWSSAKNGVVQSIQSEQPLQQGIWHPHSLFGYNNQLYFCNSSHQRIESLEGVVSEDLPGYARGLHVSDELLVCGTSQGRLVSHSTGQAISNIGDRGVLAGDCGIWFHNKQSNKQNHLNLSQYATEVFEVIPQL